MDSDEGADLLDDVHGLLDELHVPFANADSGGAYDQSPAW